jgi:cytochrome c oxidase cbb3-type subunit 3
MCRYAVVVLSFISLLAIAGVAAQEPSVQVIDELKPSDVDKSNAAITRHEQGRKIYNYRCYYCHGYSGDAQTLAARSLSPMPRDFTETRLNDLPRQQMINAVTQGRAGTAMTSFTKFLSSEDIELVIDFVQLEFMQNQRENTRYHTSENGWPDHDKYAIANDFAIGKVALDTPQEILTQEQRLGLQLYLASCITCHDNSKVNDPGAIWQTQSISYPRNNFSFTNFDGVTGASTYQKHDTFALLADASVSVKKGETLFRDNCAFCHAMDGTGQNWIGSFLAVKPQNLQAKDFVARTDRTALKQMILKGKVNTSMPAWQSVLTNQQIDAILDYIDVAFRKQKN